MNRQHWVCTLTVTAAVAMFMTTGARGTEGQVIRTPTPHGGIQPQAVLDAHGVLHLIYFKGRAGAGDLYYVRREPKQDFSPPIRVNSLPGSAVATGTIRGGQIALGRDGCVHVVWNGSSKAKPRGAESFPLLYSRLAPGAKTFTPERNMMGRTHGLDGGATVAADDAGHVYVAWHALGAADSAGEEHRRVWLVRSDDDGQTWRREEAVSAQGTGVCACCAMRAFVDHSGRVYLLYRSATEKVNRDMYLLVSTDHGRSFQSKKLHHWEIMACPMSSEAFAQCGDKVLCAWETEGQIYTASIDGKDLEPGQIEPAPGESRVRKHPALACNARGEHILAWTEGTGWQKGGDLVWQVFDASGKPTAVNGRARGAVPVWGLVTVVARPGGEFEIIY